MSHVGNDDVDSASTPCKRRKVDGSESTVVEIASHNPRLILNPELSHYTTSLDTQSPLHAVSDPFPCYVLPEFIDQTTIVSLRQALLDEGFPYARFNDLHEFRQTPDLISAHRPVLKQLRERFCSQEFIAMVCATAGWRDEELIADRVDISGQRYDTGGYLLCHDDDVHAEEDGYGRRVAFILYLVDEDWDCAVDGGALELFSLDEAGRPSKVTAQIEPKAGTLAFFPIVTGTSFHQVALVTGTKPRLSIAGWLHGRLPEADASVVAGSGASPVNEPQPNAPSNARPGSNSVDFVVADWVVSEYATDHALEEVNERFAKDSFVVLQNFLCANFFGEYRAQLHASFQADIAREQWHLVGPADSQRFFALRNDTLLLSSFLRSKAFQDYLYMITGLQLSGNITSSSAPATRMFDRGSYTVLRDDDQQPPGLDVTLYLPAADSDPWFEEHDGRTIYIDAESGHVVAESPVASNALVVAWRTEGVRRFTRMGKGGIRAEISLTWEVVDTDEESQ